jgi:hypothetical protein
MVDSGHLLIIILLFLFFCRIICINRLDFFFIFLLPFAHEKVAKRTNSVAMAGVCPFPFSATVRPTVQMEKTKVIASSQVHIQSFYFILFYYSLRIHHSPRLILRKKFLSALFKYSDKSSKI